MRTLLKGDTHGSELEFRYAFEIAKRYECNNILSLGDFGYWEHTASGIHFLDTLSALAEQYGIDIEFLCGNHENHPLLWHRYMGWNREGFTLDLPHDKKAKGKPMYVVQQAKLNRIKGEIELPTPTAEGFIQIRPRLFYIPRGTSWTWDGVKFLVVGGAMSIDKGVRRPGMSWWQEEAISDEHVAKAQEAGKVDVMLTHDTPSAIDMWQAHIIAGYYSFKILPHLMDSRWQLQKVWEVARPAWLFHGHYHINYAMNHVDPGGFTTRVMGLAQEGTEQASWWIFDTAEYPDRT
jgi:hypothetical protein